MKKKTETKTQKYREALIRILNQGIGLKPEVIDWARVGKNSKIIAARAIAEKCRSCGKEK